MEMTDALKAHIEGRLEKLREHFEQVMDAKVVLAVEKHRHIAEISLHANGVHLHGRESSSDMYISVDAVVDKLDKQVRKYKDRINRSHSRKAKEFDEYHHNIIEMPEPEEEEPKAAVRHHVIMREKLFMKPMGVEEATLQLELSDEPFLVFLNEDTQQVNVIYARDDGTYGLIEPQF